MNALLEVTNYNEPITNISDKFLFGGQILLIGMCTVFLVLIIIWLTLTIFKLVFHDLPSKKKIVVKPVKEEPVVQMTSAATNNNDEEIVAVIAAAIAAAESESAGVKFKVVSFNRK